MFFLKLAGILQGVRITGLVKKKKKVITGDSAPIISILSFLVYPTNFSVNLVLTNFMLIEFSEG